MLSTCLLLFFHSALQLILNRVTDFRLWSDAALSLCLLVKQPSPSLAVCFSAHWPIKNQISVPTELKPDGTPCHLRMLWSVSWAKPLPSYFVLEKHVDTIGSLCLINTLQLEPKISHLDSSDQKSRFPLVFSATQPWWSLLQTFLVDMCL